MDDLRLSQTTPTSLVVIRRSRQFVDLEPHSLRGGLHLERLHGRMTDGLGDPIG